MPDRRVRCFINPQHYCDCASDQFSIEVSINVVKKLRESGLTLKEAIVEFKKADSYLRATYAPPEVVNNCNHSPIKKM